MPTRRAGRWRAVGPLAGVAACLLLAAVLADPFGEFLPADDGFAYARSVQHLLHSGEYKLDAWSAANMPVQIYLAAGLSKVFGYSLDLLKLTTVGMLGVGLASFYGLARELGAARGTSFAATLALLASPLTLLLAFSFQSDVQFMGWLILALFLYVRAIRQDSDGLVFLGSLAAAGAIGTRQLGVAIIGGLVVAWVLARHEDRPRLRTALLAAAIPTVAAVLQFRSGLQEPTFTQVVRLYEQGLYFDQPVMVLAHEFVWRVAIVLQYVGISLLPALPLVAAAAVACASRPRRTAKRLFAVAILTGLALCATLLAGSPLTAAQMPRLRQWPWPPLGLEWLLPYWLPPDLILPIDLLGVALAAVFGAVVVYGTRAPWPIRRHRPETTLLVSIPIIMFGLHLAYRQLNDTYILAFVPFALLLLVIQSRENATPRLAVMATGAALTVIVVVSLGLRADFAADRTRWAAADRLVAAGVPTSEIYVPWGSWMNYHGAFDEWIAAGHPGFELRRLTRPILYWLHGPYFMWELMRSENATYRIVDHRISAPGWRLIQQNSYLGDAFQRHEVLTYARQSR